ncbi:MAG: hypothetical protein A2Z16_08495 [Chloroflexi bacterium RBG_16_54_18]|nr:MAG: hypothetical protein A2Z16_08495 [Chloroflexi bacterium RBG_16_54_18]
MRTTRLLPGLFLLSAASLSFEINLTRLFAVSQFYHFAFMIVSIALLGYGASGSVLAAFPQIKRNSIPQTLYWSSLGAALSILGSYLVVNWLPFDSFSMAWDRRQVLVLVFHFLVLSTPFFFTGIAVGLVLAADPDKANQTYAANLGGSALGCLVLLLAPALVGGEGMVVLAALISAAAALIFLREDKYRGPGTAVNQLPDMRSDQFSDEGRWVYGRFTIGAAVIAIVFLVSGSAELVRRIQGSSIFPALELRLSPYKSLSYAQQYPDSEVIYRKWNSVSRLDLVRSSGIRSFPGMSFNYTQKLPAQDGLFIDGDDLSPVVRPGADLEYTRALPASIALQMRPGASVLALEPRGGQDILTAVAGGAHLVTAVEANPLVFEAAAPIYSLPQVRKIASNGRSLSKDINQEFDVLILSLISSFHPVRSGAYSLSEDYRYTVEAFQDYLQRLSPAGILVFTRWIQSPPTESLRAFATILTALEAQGGDPQEQVSAFRSYNTITYLVKNQPFTQAELALIKEFTEQSAYDLVYLPGLEVEETNRFNILPEPEDYLAFRELVHSQDRNAFYRSYPYAVEPATDDRPFFGHYFRWSQTPQIFAELGMTWQPFGGAGYFVLLALLMIALCLSGMVILLPVWIIKRGGFWKHTAAGSWPGGKLPKRYPFYFGLLGLAFLLVEIPLIQSFILYLGSPAYAFAVVVFSLLASSGVGSLVSDRIQLPFGLALIAFNLVLLQFIRPLLVEKTLGWLIESRMALVFIVLAPLGLFMGTAFPGGIRWMVWRPGMQAWIPWIWAINGAASVISAILAALLALSFGFGFVLRLGMVCYLAAWLVVMASERRSPARYLAR